jgi:tRNA nucleotidyltransferase (CCA-adding enzyme)
MAAMKIPAQIHVPDEVLRIIRTLEEAGHEAWCVGGAIRDALLDLDGECADYDVATAAHPDVVQALFRHTVAVGLRYGTVGVLDKDRVLHEVTTFRHDVATNGRHAEVAFGASLDDDLARRDFTINAIAYHPLRHEWRDLHEGTQDLDRKLIRAVGNPAERFREDYLRILRAIRFCARLGFTIDRDTWDAAKQESEGLRGLSAERVRDEWFKGLRTTQSVTRLVKLWISIGAASIWLPELSHGEGDSVERTGAESTAERDPIVLTTLVCVDSVGVLQRLKASNQQIARAVALMAGPHEPGGTGALATRRWLAAVGEAADDLVALWEARNRAPFPWAGAIREIRERGDPLTRADLAIGGNDLVALDVPAGPAVGSMLEELLAAVVDDPDLNTRERLVTMVKEVHRERGVGSGEHGTSSRGQ